MALARQIETYALETVQGGMAQFYTPQASDETMLVELPPHAQDDLFVHRYQTDQLFVVRGRFVLVVLENRRYRYVPMQADDRQMVKIPPGVPHGAINFSDEPCFVVNAVLRHGDSHPKDYQPLKRPFEYDREAAWRSLTAYSAETACAA